MAPPKTLTGILGRPLEARDLALVANLATANTGRTNCDGTSFTCSTGTCYTGKNGFIGCCTAPSCAPRTTCLEYTDYPTTTCHPDTGGCLTCSANSAPLCGTITNELMNQYFLYCSDTVPFASQIVTYSNNFMGSVAGAPSPAEATVTAESQITVPATSTVDSSSVSSSTLASPVTTYSSPSSFEDSPTSGFSTKSVTSPSSLKEMSSSIISATPISTISESTTFAQNNSTTRNSTNLSNGAVAGITVGATISMITLFAVLLFLYIRHKRKPNHLKRTGSFSFTRRPLKSKFKEDFQRSSVGSAWDNEANASGSVRAPVPLCIETDPGNNQSLGGASTLVSPTSYANTPNKDPPWSPTSITSHSHSHPTSPELHDQPLPSIQESGNERLAAGDNPGLIPRSFSGRSWVTRGTANRMDGNNNGNGVEGLAEAPGCTPNSADMRPYTAPASLCGITTTTTAFTSDADVRSPTSPISYPTQQTNHELPTQNQAQTQTFDHELPTSSTPTPNTNTNTSTTNNTTNNSTPITTPSTTEPGNTIADRPTGSRLSASGIGPGYMSAETALAGGWKND
ncbi:MAG: hypothetical protein M1834_005613 [Cirrosporium novae-zelandiae]|nr:MAG: hypothetical protein M1834_005613 [Cirrosporium novae-zelandiae]